MWNTNNIFWESVFFRLAYFRSWLLKKIMKMYIAHGLMVPGVTCHCVPGVPNLCSHPYFRQSRPTPKIIGLNKNYNTFVCILFLYGILNA